MNVMHNISIIVAGILIAIGLTNIATSIREQTTQAQASLSWGMKLDCYYIVESEKKNGKLSSFNMEECDY